MLTDLNVYCLNFRFALPCEKWPLCFGLEFIGSALRSTAAAWLHRSSMIRKLLPHWLKPGTIFQLPVSIPIGAKIRKSFWQLRWKGSLDDNWGSDCLLGVRWKPVSSYQTFRLVSIVLCFYFHDQKLVFKNIIHNKKIRNILNRKLVNYIF